jgi:valyl-tRNA synthetase
VLHRFFWNEYCDWYIEASKVVLQGKDSAQKANTLAVIDFILSHTLRLFHPFLPFITEELWHSGGFCDDMPDNRGGKTIMFAHWPQPLDEAFKKHYGLTRHVADFVERKYELVRQGRNLRDEAKIQAGTKVKFVLKSAEHLSNYEIDVLRILLGADPLESNVDYQPKKGTPSVRGALGELYLPLEGLIDIAAEKARLNREMTKTQVEIDKVQQKLSNPGFIQKAPPQVLEEHQRRLAEWQVKQEQVQNALEALDG